MLSNSDSLSSRMYPFSFSISSLQRLKHASQYLHLCELDQGADTPLSMYRRERRKMKSQSGDVRKGIICYIMALVALTISVMMIYGTFFA